VQWLGPSKLDFLLKQWEAKGRNVTKERPKKVTANIEHKTANSTRPEPIGQPEVWSDVGKTVRALIMQQWY
jgi:hypothetical protein